MDIEAEKQRCQRAENQIKVEKEIIRESKLAVALSECPFDVGDKVINGNGETETIALISFYSWPSSYDSRAYQFKVFKTKKDGKPYKDSSYVWNYKGYKKA